MLSVWTFSSATVLLLMCLVVASSVTLVYIQKNEKEEKNENLAFVDKALKYSSVFSIMSVFVYSMILFVNQLKELNIF